MGKINKAIRHKLYIKTGAIIVAALLLLCAAVYIIHAFRSTNLRITENKKIDLTPLQIKSLERIGEWEFLAISDEEMVDTVSKGFFSDSELTRIYYGTVRLGIRLSDARPGWIRQQGDSIICILPPIQLLDKDFIDEARTKAFIEKGHWTDSDRDHLYHKAYEKMLKRCMNTENIRTAESNASKQFFQLLRAMGFHTVCIRIATAQDHKEK